VPALAFPEPPLRDELVALRPWHRGDDAARAAWGSDAEIVRWTGVPAGYTEEAARAHAERLEAARRAGEKLSLAVVDASSGELLGACDLRLPEPLDPALGELGYLLAERARGRGAAARAVWLLLDWAFAELGLARVQALVHPQNPASRAVLERLGFRREGLLHAYRARGDGREDREIFALLRGELRRPRP
jgi:RimJ/RimL family protein N-acetyltransferase